MSIYLRGQSVFGRVEPGADRVRRCLCRSGGCVFVQKRLCQVCVGDVVSVHWVCTCMIYWMGRDVFICCDYESSLYLMS